MASYLINSSADAYYATPTNKALIRTPTGRLITAVNKYGTLTFFYSDNNGQSWSAFTGTIPMIGFSGTAQLFSLHMSLDGKLHCAYDSTGATVALRTGTISGSTITWGSPGTISYSNTAYLMGNVVTYRLSADTETYAVLVWWDAITERIMTGVWKRPDATGVWEIVGQWIERASASYGGGSVDFRHNGDGRTLAVANTPDFYVISKDYNDSQVYFRRYASTGTETWSQGTYKGMETSGATGYDQPTGVFDGTRFISGAWHGNSPYVNVWEIEDPWSAGVDLGPPAFPGTTTAKEVAIEVNASGGLKVAAIASTAKKIYVTNYYRASDTWDDWLEVVLSATPIEGSGLLAHQGGSSQGYGVHHRLSALDDTYFYEVGAMGGGGANAGWGIMPL